MPGAAKYLLLVTAVFVCAVWLASAHAQDGHDKWHETYKNWTDGKGMSCCSGKDCRPAKVRWRGVWQARIGDRWCDIPEAVVRRYKSPDGGPHVCSPVPIQPDRPCKIYCYVHGEVKG